MALVTISNVVNSAGPISLGMPADSNLSGREIVGVQFASEALGTAVRMAVSIANCKLDSGALYTYTVAQNAATASGVAVFDIPPASVVPSASGITTITFLGSGAATGTAYIFYNPIFKTGGMTGT